MNKNFEEIYGINVNEKTEEKNGLTYLSWAWAWAEFKKIFHDATYKIRRFADGAGREVPYMYDPKTGYMVFTEVTADSLTYEMWLPVMDNKNKAMLTATMTDINKAIMRCLTKNLAMFGLGLYIYAGEDLPEGYVEPKEPLDEKLVEELKELGGSLEVVATYYKCAITDLTNEHIKTMIDGKKKALAKAGKNA